MDPIARLIALPLASIVMSAPAHALIYMSVEQAQQLMFHDQALRPVPLQLSAAEISAIERDAGVRVFPGSFRAWKADNGYFFVDAVIGKHDLISYALALTSEGKVRQTEILEYREAYGGEVRNTHWRAQFNGRQHGDPVRIGSDIQNISGATLSCAHLTDGIRRLLAIYAVAIAGR